MPITPPTTRLFKCDPASITFSGDKPIYSDPETEDAIKAAAEHLTERHVVAFPTETVYGLGALALDPSAAAKIFSTKGRPSDNPLIVHISSPLMLSTLLPPSYTPSPAYETLMRTFWPGPLTLLFPADPSRVPRIITAGHPTVAVRMPAHPVARALIATIGVPLAAPSANASGKPSPTRAAHVLRDLGSTGRLPLLLDGGVCAVGLESTVVDGLNADDGALRVLRPGGATVEALVAALGDIGDGDGNGARPRVLVHRRDFVLGSHELNAPTTPGMKYRHYAPSVPVTLLYTTTPSPADDDGGVGVGTPRRVGLDAFFREIERGASDRVGLMAQDDSPLLARARWEGGTRWLTFSLGESAEPARAAQRLFEGLLSLEEQGVEQIFVQEVAEEREGLAFMNRIKKAAGTSLRIVDV